MKSKRNPRQGALLGALAVLALSLLVWWQVGQWYEARLLREQRAEAAVEASLRGNVLGSLLNRRLARLEGLAAFVETLPSEERLDEVFEPFAERLLANTRVIRSLAVAPDGTIRYVYPREGNEAILGYQPLFDPRENVRADARRAVDTGAVIVSGPLELLQGGLGLVARQAIYKDGSFWGLVNMALELPPLLEEAGIASTVDVLEYALRDSTGRVFYGDPAVFARDPVVNRIQLPEGEWELAAAPVGGWSTTLPSAFLMFGVGGLLMVILITTLVYLTINRQATLQTAVAERTLELAQANALLEERVQERTAELETLLQIGHDMASTLKLDPLLEILLDQLRGMVAYSSASVYLYRNENGRDVLQLIHYRGPLDPETLREQWPSRQWPLPGSDQEVTRQRTPLIIADVQGESTAADAWRAATATVGINADYVRSWMGVPLLSRNRVIGLLTLEHRLPDHYDSRDAALALAVGHQGANAIENARLYEEAQSLAVLQERQRLARELHDSVSQALYGIGLGTLTAQRLLAQGRLEAAGDSLVYAHSLAEAALAEMRALIFELRPESLVQEGLAATLEKQAAAVRARHRLTVETELCEEPVGSLAVKEVLYRVAQEALHNVVKHADADRIQLQLLCEAERVGLRVEDNGQGFDPEQAFPGHLGLRSMQERVAQVGGQFLLESTPGKGTQVEVWVPLQQ